MVRDRDPAMLGLARFLGWFSLALGGLELLAPRALARGLGMPRSRALIATYGLRETATGIAILSAEDPTPWIWGRVGGDAMDVATLLGGLCGNRRKGCVALALTAVLGATALDVICAQGLSQD